MSNINQKFQTIRKEMNVFFKERNQLVDGTLVALLSRQHLFILGPAGTAKSMTCEAVCEAIDGKFFSYLMSKFTAPEELFGPISIAGLKEDKYHRITSNRLPEADIVFLDEIFKSSSSTLNTLLSIMNERKFYNNGVQQIPLQSIFAASNEVPQGEELAPMYDRFALKFVVDRIKDDNNFKSLIETNKKPTLTKITLAELKQAQEEASKLPITSAASDKLVELRRKVDADLGLYVSDRKWVQSISLIKAYAYLNGHASIEVEDLTVLENALWTQPDQITEVRNLVRKLCNPLAEIITRNMDAAHEVINLLQTGKASNAQILEVFKKLKAAKNNLSDLLIKNNEREDLKEAVNKLETLCKQVSERLLNG